MVKAEKLSIQVLIDPTLLRQDNVKGLFFSFQEKLEKCIKNPQVYVIHDTINCGQILPSLKVNLISFIKIFAKLS